MSHQGQISPSSSSFANTTSKKSVSFNRKAKVRLALHISDYKTEEVEACFYGEYDFLRFRQDAKLTAQQVDKNGSLPFMNDNGEFCERGVEGYTMEGAARRAINRKLANVAVLVEQERLRYQQGPAADGEEKEEFDNESALSSTCHGDESIAASYSIAVFASVESAYRTGLSDEKEAKAKSTVGTRESAGARAGKKNKKTTRLGGVVDIDYSCLTTSRKPFVLASMMRKHKGGEYLRRLVGGTSSASS